MPHGWLALHSAGKNGDFAAASAAYSYFKPPTSNGKPKIGQEEKAARFLKKGCQIQSSLVKIQTLFKAFSFGHRHLAKL